MNKKFAVVGKGFIYNKHAEAITGIGGEIVDVVDDSKGPDTWKEIVKNTKADCIVILAPNYLHFEMAKFSAQCGKIVLCEKPLALKSDEVKVLSEYPNIFTVHQLRYHPLAEKLKSEIKEDQNYQIEINISVHRDDHYWKSWIGAKEKSGGVIFNLAIHYFDLLFYLFGEPVEVSTDLLTEKAGEGKISGRNYSCVWKISAEAPVDNQCRLFKINGINYDFSSKDNLHIFVYKDLLEGKGITPKESALSIELIEKIYENFKK